MLAANPISVPYGSIAVTYTSVNEFFCEIFEEKYKLNGNRTYITIPPNFDSRYLVESDFGEVHISCNVLNEYGWVIVNGLPYKNCLNFFDGMTAVVVPHEEHYLIPPHGLWPYNLPELIQKGEILVDKTWLDIFEANKELLTRSGLLNPRDHPFGNFEHIKLADGTAWTVHKSVQGIQQLLLLKYGPTCKTQFYLSEENCGKVAHLIVPDESQIPMWIGAGGRVAKLLAEMVGAEFTKVQVCK